MTFFSRMTTETGAPMPRFLYLIDKVAHTALITLLLWRLTPLSLTRSAGVATLLYVGIGLFLWYRHGVKQWIGPGSFTGDLMYHFLPSIFVMTLVMPFGWVDLAACLFVGATWWQLDTDGYGPMRSPVST